MIIQIYKKNASIAIIIGVIVGDIHFFLREQKKCFLTKFSLYKEKTN